MRWLAVAFLVIFGVGVGFTVARAFSGYSQHAAAFLPVWFDTGRTFTIHSSAPMDFGALTGQLRDMTVTERTEKWTNRVVRSPRLRGTLKIRNGSPNESALVLGWTVGFLDRAGHLIPVAARRVATGVALSTREGLRVDPDQDTGVAIDVPFPRAALAQVPLNAIQVALSYQMVPCRKEVAQIPVNLRPSADRSAGTHSIPQILNPQSRPQSRAIGSGFLREIGWTKTRWCRNMIRMISPEPLHGAGGS